jgi:diguanylate cyclase (GGDEF)-like protein/PAS domain S-box-containing protein
VQEDAKRLEVAVQRLRALVAVAGAMLDSVGNERRMLSLVADGAAETIGATATTWLLPIDEAVPAEHVSQHADDVTRRLVAAASDHLRTDGSARYVALDALRQDGVEGAVIAAMAFRGRVLGGVAVTRKPDETFTEQEIEFIDALAAATAATISNARVVGDSAAILEDLRRQGELLDHISDAIVACDADDLIVSWNAGAERLYGYPAADAVGCDVFALLATNFFTSDGVPMDRKSVDETLAEYGRWGGELRERRADAVPLTVMTSITRVTGPDGERQGLVVVNRDVSEQRREEHRALHDTLTDLPNRRMLVNRLYDALARSFRSGGPLAVLFLDLDRFKPVNDVYGHAAGDELLRVTAARLARAVRNSDLVARIGGDEFVAVLEDAGSAENVRQITQRIMNAVSEPVTIGGATVSVSASLGAVFVDEPHGGTSDPDQLIDAADAAMYKAKREHLGVYFAAPLATV